jgi:WXG100 family type VII secretion target
MSSSGYGEPSGYGGGGGAGAPAGGAILVTFQRIEDASKTCDTMVGTMDREFIELETALNAMRDKWVGQARDRYEELQRRWNMSHDNLKEILMQISKTLMQARTNYESTEAANANIWSS